MSFESVVCIVLSIRVLPDYRMFDCYFSILISLSGFDFREKSQFCDVTNAKLPTMILSTRESLRFVKMSLLLGVVCCLPRVFTRGTGAAHCILCWVWYLMLFEWP